MLSVYTKYYSVLCITKNRSIRQKENLINTELLLNLNSNRKKFSMIILNEMHLSNYLPQNIIEHLAKQTPTEL